MRPLFNSDADPNFPIPAEINSTGYPLEVFSFPPPRPYGRTIRTPACFRPAGLLTVLQDPWPSRPRYPSYCQSLSGCEPLELLREPVAAVPRWTGIPDFPAGSSRYSHWLLLSPHRYPGRGCRHCCRLLLSVVTARPGISRHRGTTTVLPSQDYPMALPLEGEGLEPA